MAGEAEQLEPVLIAVDTEEASLRALAWALDQFAFGTKPLSIHLVHVVRTLSTQLEVYLGCGPGSAYNFADPTPHHEIQDVVHAKEFLHNRCLLLQHARQIDFPGPAVSRQIFTAGWCQSSTARVCIMSCTSLWKQQLLLLRQYMKS